MKNHYHILAKSREEFDEIEKGYDKFNTNFELNGIYDLLVRTAAGFPDKLTLDVSPVNSLGKITGVLKFGSDPKFEMVNSENGRWFIKGENYDYLIHSKVPRDITF